MSNADVIWNDLTSRMKIKKSRQNFRFDPVFYKQTYIDLDGEAAELYNHYVNHGQHEGRFPNFYKFVKSTTPHLDDVVGKLVTNEDIKNLIIEGDPEAYELACELMYLGDPMDSRVSDFSTSAYNDWYEDIKKSGMNPLLHYLKYGSIEGGRRTLADVRKGLIAGSAKYSHDKPTVLICIHEMSRTGAPIVGRDLVEEASKTHNVVVGALRGGDLLSRFTPFCCAVVITENPFQEMPFVSHPSFEKIDYAILNSVECSLFISYLVSKKIPFASYLHEYADYTFPVWKSTITGAFSDVVVFSSEHVRTSWSGRLSDIRFNEELDTAILPQRELIINSVTEEAYHQARKRVSEAIGKDLSDSKVICGAGHVQWRKGTDIFIATSQISKILDPETVYIWIGDGRNSEDLNFGVWLDFHLKSVSANAESANIYFIPAGSLYKDVLISSDAMFLSSRLDPLPNVVFDALESGCRVVCFEGGTGFGDQMYKDTDFIEAVEYANPNAAAVSISMLPRKVPEDIVQSGAKKEQNIFKNILEILNNRIANLDLKVSEGSSGSYDIPILFSTDQSDKKNRKTERDKIRAYNRMVLWKDPFEAERELTSSKSWVHKYCGIRKYEEMKVMNTKIPKFNLHIHAFYTDDLEVDIMNHAIYQLADRVVVTTDSNEKAELIVDIFERYAITVEVRNTGNVGRDILPFLRIINDEKGSADDIWCHVHQKKSLTSATGGDVWKRFLLKILLGNENYLSNCANIISEKAVGLVAPFDPHFISWTASRKLMSKFDHKFAEGLPPEPLLFPIGNMFWTKSSVAKAMLELFGNSYPWPNEPVANDGTEYHFIERLWPTVAASKGLRSEFIYKLDEVRI